MPIDPELATSTNYPDLYDSWDADRVILYHLGLAAGGEPTSYNELAYVAERHLKVLPAFSVIPGFEGVRPALQGPGLDYHLSRMLHGEQDLVVHNPLPVEAKIVTRGRVESVYDKGKAAIAVLRADTDLDDGTPLTTNRFRLFIRGEGGFGGDLAPEPEPWVADGKPLFEAEFPTLVQQAAIYRLSGDRNPLHIDPKFAQKAGFERPILHGLCTYGMVLKAVVDRCLDGDTGAVTRWSSRFAASIYPGETLVVAAWQQDKRIVVEARIKERGDIVLTNGVVTTK